MTKKFTYSEKHAGDQLTHTEWNNLAQDVEAAVNAINSGSTGGGSGSTVVIEGDSHVKYDATGKHNLTIETTASDQYVDNGKTKGGKINIESVSDIQLKPGDDIILYSHHRGVGKQDEVAVKVTDGDDIPVKLQVNTSEINLTTKDKTGTNADVMDIAINNDTNSRGYLKVRAQAIDLRCEKHGGVALQPKGYDSDGNMNKIKFEHGGGDGLEFGTFNTEKTSIFTDEYRFNKDGVWKMATRQTTASGKEIRDEGTIPTGKTATGAVKYVKQADDFYDIINLEDPETTTEAIIKTAGTLNNEYVETSLSSKKNLKIDTISHYRIVDIIESDKILESSGESFAEGQIIGELGDNWYFTSHTKDELKLIVGDQDNKLSDYIANNKCFGIGASNYFIEPDIAPKISISSEEEVDLESKYGDVVITSGDTIKNEAPEIRLNAIKEDKSGGTVNFGATQDVVFINSKLTKGLKVEASATPTKIKLVLQNNSIDTVYWDETNGIFRVPVKHIYADNEQTTEITPSNYSTYKEQAAYFADGTKLPADYTCFIAVTTENSGTYTTDIYKVSTKGSSDVLSKNIKGPVGRYTSSTSGVLGDRVSLGTSDELTTLEFELYTYEGGAGVSAVSPDSFVTQNKALLSDVINIAKAFDSDCECRITTTKDFDVTYLGVPGLDYVGDAADYSYTTTQSDTCFGDTAGTTKFSFDQISTAYSDGYINETIFNALTNIKNAGEGNCSVQLTYNEDETVVYLFSLPKHEVFFEYDKHYPGAGGGYDRVVKASIKDIVTLVNWMKDNEQGPWE